MNRIGNTYTRPNTSTRLPGALAVLLLLAGSLFAQDVLQPVVPKHLRGRNDAERSGTHDAGNIRTVFYNYGMVGSYPDDPINVDLSIFHSAEVPKGTGMNYTDGITPFVLARVMQQTGVPAYIMETGFRERQVESPYTQKIMRFEPRPGYLQADPGINVGRSIAMSNDSRTWPGEWPDKLSDPFDPGWRGSWNGYFGKRPNADQESFFVMDDDFYDAWNFYPDATRDMTRRGLGLRVEVRGFQWANPQATNVIFWHYDIVDEGSTDYSDIIFGLYMDSGVGGSTYSCDGIAESDDDNAYFDRSFGLNLTYTWDKFGHGTDLSSNCSVTGYLGYAYLETPGNSYNAQDDDQDGIVDERRDGPAGDLVVGRDNIRARVQSQYNMTMFETFYGPLESRPAYRVGRWWTGDENLTWVGDYDDVGGDGLDGTNDPGEGDGMPTDGEPDFNQTDKDESDQIGLTGFKMNRIKGPSRSDPVDDIVFFGLWPPLLFQQFTDPDPSARFDASVVLNYNIGFLFASGPFQLPKGKRERFSLALAYGADLDELRTQVKTVQQIYNANYQFAVPPPVPVVRAETGDTFVRLSWSDVSERGIDPVTRENDFEGYRIYRSTDPEFRDPKVVTNARGTGSFGNGRPIAQFDLKNDIKGFSHQVIEGVAYDLGTDSGLKHTYTDTLVNNGQEYFYAVCAYDRGSDSLGFYPSENAIPVSRTPRGGVVLPPNVVQVRPEPRVPGFIGATVFPVRQLQGTGTAEISIEVVDSKQVPAAGTYHLRFATDRPNGIHASRYELVDSLTQKAVFSFGTDFAGEGRGPVGHGLLPVIKTPEFPQVDTLRSGFRSGAVTNAKLRITNVDPDSTDVRRPGYPNDFRITFGATPLDTSILSIYGDPLPVKFRVEAVQPTGAQKMGVYFLDANADSTLSVAEDMLIVVTSFAGASSPSVTWLVQIDTSGPGGAAAVIPPAAGDIYDALLSIPLGDADVFSFAVSGQRVDGADALGDYASKPYVVPNPYVGAASFEPERFAVTGRGERRMEFRGVPVGATVRIYTVAGYLVQTLRHDGTTDSMIPWNLRTKDNLDVAPGLYLFHVEAQGFDDYTGKFAIVR
ncbi:MAG: hypothetical protein IT282_04070 [Bacteroidetes bacterium]|nr:hypothetical protein [Bacteroidota bacterium]